MSDNEICTELYLTLASGLKETETETEEKNTNRQMISLSGTK